MSREFAMKHIYIVTHCCEESSHQEGIYSDLDLAQKAAMKVGLGPHEAVQIETFKNVNGKFVPVESGDEDFVSVREHAVRSF